MVFIESGGWPATNVWHFSRHPQPFVSSLMAFGFWRMNAAAIHPHLRRTGDDFADSYRYWVDWNRKILSVPEPRRISFRIEDCTQATLHELAQSIAVETKRLAIPQWNEKQAFAPIPDKVRADVEEMMGVLGYA